MSGLRHPDPRMGDEDEDLESQDRHEIPSRRSAAYEHRKEVKVNLSSLSTSTSDDSNPTKGTPTEKPVKKPNPLIHNSVVDFILNKVLIDFSWIPANFSWRKIKPVIRSTILGFLSVVFLVIPRVEHALGNVSHRPLPICLLCIDRHIY